jgi:hypothetical protein
MSISVDLTKPGELAIALLDAIIQLSDHAQEMGGATSISGVAALHKMQTSIQKNKQRMQDAIAAAQRETP